MRLGFRARRRFHMLLLGGVRALKFTLRLLEECSLHVGQLIFDLKRYPQVFPNRFNFGQVAMFQIMQCQWLEGGKGRHFGTVLWHVNTGGVQIRPPNALGVEHIRRQSRRVRQ